VNTAQGGVRCVAVVSICREEVSHMLRSRSIAFLLFAAAGLVVIEAPRAQDYAYPYQDPITATLTSALIKGDDRDRAIRAATTTEYLSIFPERELVKGVTGERQLVYKLYRQRAAAPLVFVVGGVGANVFSGLSRYTADLLFRDGFHVIVLPSPFNWNFTLTASRSALPGVTDEDAADIYNVMKLTLAAVRRNHGIEVTRIGAVGFSMGALQLAWVSEVDRIEGSLGIERFLLVNPPVELEHAVASIDELARAGGQFSRQERERLLAYAFGFGIEQLQRDIKDPGYFQGLDERFQVPEAARKWLIGYFIQLTTDQVLTVSELLNRQSLVDEPVTLDVQTTGGGKAAGYTFGRYMNEVLLPVWAQRLDTDDPMASLRERADLLPILDKLAANPEVYLVHNRDDFLVSAAHLERLAAALGDRARIYPLGGHIGNLWYPENGEHIRGVFAPLR
jgi:hypothetical protein